MSSPNDPKGFLQQAPHLITLMHHPEIRQAVQEGDGKKLHQALMGKVRSEMEHERNAAQELLTKRRLFAEPVESAPSMTTWNTIGSRLYFSDDRDESTGVFISTLCFCILFLPLYPLADYLVRHDGGNSYTFFGKLPLSSGNRTWRHIMHALVLVAAGAMGVQVWHSSKVSTVHLLNGLDVPVVYTIGGATQVVNRESRMTMTVPVGPQHVSIARKDGAVIEELDLDVPRWMDVVAINALGAAPLYKEGIVYSDPPTQEENPFVFHGGERLVVDDAVRYVFEEAPHTISTKSKRETRWMVDTMRGGWRTTAHVLEKDRPKEALALVRAVLMAQPDEAKGEDIHRFLELCPEEEVMEFARTWAEKFPLSLPPNHLLQSQLVNGDQEEEALTRYRALLEKNPQSPEAAYLLARLLPNEEALPMYKQWVEKFPNHVPLRSFFAHRLHGADRYAEATEQYVPLCKLDGGEARASLQVLLESALLAGRPGDAVEMAALVLEGKKDLTVEEAVMYARAARIRGEADAPKPADHFIRLLVKQKDVASDAAAWAHILLNGAVTDEELATITDEDAHRAAEVMLDAWKSVEAALDRAEKTDDDALSRVPSEASLLLAAEAVRQGKLELAERLMDSEPNHAPPMFQKMYLDSGNEALLQEMEPIQRAALCLARARKLRKGAEAEALYAKAKQEDAFNTVISAALRNWKRP